MLHARTGTGRRHGSADDRGQCSLPRLKQRTESAPSCRKGSVRVSAHPSHGTPQAAPDDVQHGASRRFPTGRARGSDTPSRGNSFKRRPLTPQPRPPSTLPSCRSWQPAPPDADRVVTQRQSPQRFLVHRLLVHRLLVHRQAQRATAE